VGCEKLNETQALASIYSLVILDRTEVTEEYRVYAPKKRVFWNKSMKTKGLFSRYPLKISLLKDLAEGISGGFPAL
jgi:hypothetical protein